jgi:hypothetical protein
MFQRFKNFRKLRKWYVVKLKLVDARLYFVSIFVMFTALHLDMKYSRLYREVQMLRERSTRLQEQRFRHTTHSAILEELRRRGIDLYDPVVPGEILDD